MSMQSRGTRVRFENVSKSYGRVAVLHDIDLEAPGGTTTCIVGPSGSGKSTLLRCANLMERPQAGRILLDDLDITLPGVDIDKEKPAGVIVQYGGQTPLKLSRALEAAGAPIIGTTPDAIDVAEDRERFQQLVQVLNLKQPPNCTARTEDQAISMSKTVGFPLIVRPSYVLGGRAMEVVFNEEDLRTYMTDAVKV